MANYPLDVKISCDIMYHLIENMSPNDYYTCKMFILMEYGFKCYKIPYRGWGITYKPDNGKDRVIFYDQKDYKLYINGKEVKNKDNIDKMNLYNVLTKKKYEKPLPDTGSKKYKQMKEYLKIEKDLRKQINFITECYECNILDENEYYSDVTSKALKLMMDRVNIKKLLRQEIIVKSSSK